MKTLVVMRHSKAERGPGKADFDRTLEPRGWTEGDSVGARLAALGIAPDVVLCSAARRTRDTFAAVLPHFQRDCVVHLRRALYDAEVGDLHAAVREASGDTVMLIGHNPSVHGLAQLFAAGSPAASALSTGFPTSTAAVFRAGAGGLAFDRLVQP